MKRSRMMRPMLLVAAVSLWGCADVSEDDSTFAPVGVVDSGLPVPGHMGEIMAAANQDGAVLGAPTSDAGVTLPPSGWPDAGALGLDAGMVFGADASTAPSPTDAAVGDASTDAEDAATTDGQGDAGNPEAGAPPDASNDAGMTEDPCGPDAMPVSGMSSTSGDGHVTMFTSGSAAVISTSTTLLVPDEPTSRGTLFIWPGIQPSSSGGLSGFGVLQPVLTWGSSCNGSRPGWWISGEYVYYTSAFGGARCETGDLMDVQTDDLLDIEMFLKGTVWTQKITNRRNGKSVSYDRDLKGQRQVEVLFDIEIVSSTKPTEDVIFTSNVIKFSEPQPRACVPTAKGRQDYVSAARVSSDGKTCCIDKIILRGAGVPATTPNQP